MPEAWHATADGKAVTQDQLENVSRELLAAGKACTIWLFFGEMGAGKTTLIKSIGRVLGVTDVMSSPTFPIVNEYDTRDGGKVYHFDFYRIQKEQEVFDIGTEEYFDSGEWCLVEWPEKLGERKPSKYLAIRITATGPDHRRIEYQVIG